MVRKKIRFLQSHAIQYHSPLYDSFARIENVDFKVWYCSDYGLEKSGKRYHPEFGELPNWDIHLVQGHPHEILKNSALKKGIFNGFWGLVNWEIYTKLKTDKPDVLVILGWNYFTLVWAVFCCKLLRITVYVRGDNTMDLNQGYSQIKKWIKKVYFSTFLFPLYAKIGYTGLKNKDYFLHYSVKPNQLLHLPHAVNNEHFNKYFKDNIKDKEKIKEDLELTSSFYILFVGRLHPIKRIHDLLDALAILQGNMELIVAGGGDLEKELHSYASKKGISSYRITGFQNQSDLWKYYLASDVIVLPSQRETWGLVINEAMCFHLPVIVSDKVGCSSDLVTKDNGFVFPVGNVSKLAEHIQYLYDFPDERLKMGDNSGHLIRQFSYQTIIQNILKSIDDSIHSHI